MKRNMQNFTSGQFFLRRSTTPISQLQQREGPQHRRARRIGFAVRPEKVLRSGLRTR
jgi:hypothetical protein